MDTSILEDIGLSSAEIKVYMALLELGSSSAGPILDKSGLQNSVVHMTLNRLMEKGIISIVREGKKNIYSAANPRHLLEFIDDKKRRFEELLPRLLLREGAAQSKPEVVAFRGVKGMRELLMELLQAGGNEHHTIGSTEKALMMGDAFWIGYHKKRAAMGIKAKLVFNESLASWKAETKYPKAEVRYTKQGFEPLTETIIRNDMVGIIIWSPKPLGVIIHQKEAADSYEAYFSTVWMSAGRLS